MLVAMAGLAEVAVGMELMIWQFSLLIILVLSSLAAWKHSSTLAGAAALALSLFTILFTPWQMFAPPLTPDDLSDPDVEYWLGRFRTAAYLWLVFGGVSIALMVIAVVGQRKQHNITGDNEPDQPTDG